MGRLRVLPSSTSPQPTMREVRRRGNTMGEESRVMPETRGERRVRGSRKGEARQESVRRYRRDNQLCFFCGGHGEWEASFGGWDGQLSRRILCDFAARAFALCYPFATIRQLVKKGTRELTDAYPLGGGQGTATQ